MSPYLLGIDSGNTATKAVIFDEEGCERGSGSINSVHSTPYPRWVEQDMEKIWKGCCKVIREALTNAGIKGHEISGIGLTGHGDGVYLVDGEGLPVRPGILSLDSRAYEILDRWQEAGVFERALQLNGQVPFAALPTTLLAWLKEREPENFGRSRYVLYVKDWLRYKLTGQYATDMTEASSGFTDVHTQDYSDKALSLYSIAEVKDKLPPIVGCTEVAGKVTRKAAKETGLSEGTPVVGGAHDVDAAAIGVGCFEPGHLTTVVGTWSINEVISSEPELNSAWACRNFVAPGLWMNISASPASASNLEWFVHHMNPLEVEQAEESGISPFILVNEEVEAVIKDDSRVIYHPFLYGSPYGEHMPGGFFGLRGWHSRGHLLRALMEGVVFNHKRHIDTLRSSFDFERIRLTGGGSKSEIWSQMFADALGVNVEVTAAEEAGALGAAICAGVGTSVYDSLTEAVERTVRVQRTHEPDPDTQERLAEAYETYTYLAEVLEPVWSRLG